MTFVNNKFKAFALTSLFSATLLVLHACTGTPTEGKDVAKQNNNLSNKQKTQYAPLANDSVYDLLLAEFSLRRGVSDQAAQLYFDQAQQQQNRQLAEHAARLAHSLENNGLAIQASNLWLKLEPNNQEALSIKGVALINSNQDLASTYPLLEANASFENTAIFTHLALNAKTQAQRWRLLSYFENLEQQHPQSNNLAMAMAYLYHSTNNQAQAQHYMQRALEKDRGIEALLLNVEVSTGKNKSRALSDLKKFLNKHQDDAQIQEQALSVISQTDPEFALEVTNKLLEKNPQANLLLQLAKVNIKLNRLRNADIILQNLLISPGYKTQAHYLLGVIKRKQNLARQAIPHFFLAQQDDFLIPATESLISILISLGEQQAAFKEFKNARAKTKTANDKLHLFLLEASLYNQLGYQTQALQTFDTALIFFPDNVQLLYNRALINFSVNALAAEQDLNKILRLDPNYAPALNALAYHYTEHKSQLNKAQTLIDRALQIDPHEPQYIDTKGWLAFQQSDYVQAQQLISQAYQAQQEPSIAAHLIEALWVQGKHQESVDVWKQASIKFPGDPTIASTLQRLNINTRSLNLGTYASAPQADVISSSKVNLKTKLKPAPKTQQQLALDLINQDPRELNQASLDQLSLAEQNAAQQVPLLSAADTKNNLIARAIKITKIENSNAQTNKDQSMAPVQFAQNKVTQSLATETTQVTAKKPVPFKATNVRSVPYTSTPYIRTVDTTEITADELIVKKKVVEQSSQNNQAAMPVSKVQPETFVNIEKTSEAIDSLVKAQDLEDLNRILRLDNSKADKSLASSSTLKNPAAIDTKELEKLNSQETLMVLAANSPTATPKTNKVLSQSAKLLEENGLQQAEKMQPIKDKVEISEVFEKQVISQQASESIATNTANIAPQEIPLVSSSQADINNDIQDLIEKPVTSKATLKLNKKIESKLAKPQAIAEPDNLKAQVFIYNKSNSQAIDLHQPSADQNEIKSAKNTSLSSLQDDHYAVQLIAMISDEKFADYIAKIPESLGALKYKRVKDGYLWNIAIIGPFDKKSAARKAIQQLPKSLSQYKPWIKSVSVVVAESRSELIPIEKNNLTHKADDTQNILYSTQLQYAVFNHEGLTSHNTQVCHAENISHNNLLLSTLVNNLFPKRHKDQGL